jgi:hypothetical protein
MALAIARRSFPTILKFLPFHGAHTLSLSSNDKSIKAVFIAPKFSFDLLTQNGMFCFRRPAPRTDQDTAWVNRGKRLQRRHPVAQYQLTCRGRHLLVPAPRSSNGLRPCCPMWRTLQGWRKGLGIEYRPIICMYLRNSLELEHRGGREECPD